MKFKIRNKIKISFYTFAIILLRVFAYGTISYFIAIIFFDIKYINVLMLTLFADSLNKYVTYIYGEIEKEL